MWCAFLCSHASTVQPLFDSPQEGGCTVVALLLPCRLAYWDVVQISALAPASRVTPALTVSSGHTHTCTHRYTRPHAPARGCWYARYMRTYSSSPRSVASSSAPKLIPWSGQGFLYACMERLLWFSLHTGGQVPFHAREPQREGMSGSSQRSVPFRWWISSLRSRGSHCLQHLYSCFCIFIHEKTTNDKAYRVCRHNIFCRRSAERKVIATTATTIATVCLTHCGASLISVRKEGAARFY